MEKLLGKLPARFRWTTHNLIAHPLSEIIFLVTGNADGLSGWIHDVTIPQHEKGSGRG
jgi:hypothetical protein